MNAIVDYWWHWCVLGGLQALPVLAVAWIVDRRLAARSWTSARRIVWALVVVELLLPASLGAPLHVAGAGAVTVDVPSATGWLAVAAVAWLLGLAACLWRLVGGTCAARRRLARGASPAPACIVELAAPLARRVGLPAAPRVFIAPAVSAPCLVGFLRPIVLLPASLLDADRERIAHALLHELCHVRRRDPWRALLTQLLACLWWWHPTGWLVARRTALLRELATDAHVVRLLGAPAAYCRTLALTAMEVRMPAPATLALASTPAEVVQRITALRASAGTVGAASRLCACVAAAALLLSCVPLAGPGAVTGMPLPALDGLQGCLQRRFAVLGHLAASSRPTEPSPITPNPLQR